MRSTVDWGEWESQLFQFMVRMSNALCAQCKLQISNFLKFISLLLCNHAWLVSKKYNYILILKTCKKVLRNQVLSLFSDIDRNTDSWSDWKHFHVSIYPSEQVTKHIFHVARRWKQPHFNRWQEFWSLRSLSAEASWECKKRQLPLTSSLNICRLSFLK